MERSPVAWRLAVAIAVTVIGGLAVFQSIPSSDRWEALLFAGGCHLAILGLIAAFRASAPLVLGTAMVLLAHQVTLLYLLWSEAPDGGLAVGVLALLTLPGAAAGACIARLLECTKFRAGSRWLKALLGAVATFSGMAALLLLA